MNVMPMFRAVIQRGTNSHTFAGPGAYTETVTVSGVGDVTRAKEVLSGYTCNVNGYYGVAIYLTNATTLTIYYWTEEAGTVTCDWEIVKSDGFVQRGYISINASTSAEATGNATISAVVMANAKVDNTGIYNVTNGANLGGYKLMHRLLLTSATNVRAVLTRTNISTAVYCYYTVESF